MRSEEILGEMDRKNSNASLKCSIYFWKHVVFYILYFSDYKTQPPKFGEKMGVHLIVQM